MLALAGVASDPGRITLSIAKLFQIEPRLAPPAANQPAEATGVNEPPRSDQPSSAPLQLAPPAGGTGVGAEIVSAPSGSAPADSAAGLKAVGPDKTVIPAAEKPAEAPVQINEVKSTGPTVTAVTNGKAKKPKVDLNDESSSKKKKKKGLSKLNPF